MDVSKKIKAVNLLVFGIKPKKNNKLYGCEHFEKSKRFKVLYVIPEFPLSAIHKLVLFPNTYLIRQDVFPE